MFHFHCSLSFKCFSPNQSKTQPLTRWYMPQYVCFNVMSFLLLNKTVYLFYVCLNNLFIYLCMPQCFYLLMYLLNFFIYFVLYVCFINPIYYCRNAPHWNALKKLVTLELTRNSANMLWANWSTSKKNLAQNNHK